MDQDREEGAPPSDSTLCGGHEGPSGAQRVDQQSSEVPAQQQQTQLDSIFMLLEDNMVMFVKKELKKMQQALSADYPQCPESECEDEEQRSSREALVKVTVTFLRRMQQEELAERLQSKLPEQHVCGEELLSDLHLKEPKPPLIKEDHSEPELGVMDVERRNEEPGMKVEQECPQVKEELEDLCISQQVESKDFQTIRMPEIKVYRIDVSPLYVWKNERALANKHWNQETPELLQIKEEQDELHQQQIKEEEAELLQIKKEEEDNGQIKEEEEKMCCDQNEEQLELKQETDSFMGTFDPQKRHQSEGETNKDKLLPQNPPEADNPDQERNAEDSKSDSERPFTCQSFDKSYSRQLYLSCHMKTRIDERPFRCQICDMGFICRSKLTVHMRTHTGEKPFRCQICGKSFTQTSHLTSHIKTHTGEKPFACQSCSKSFPRRSDLTLHMRTHSSEKPFRCQTCEKTFICQTGLKRHMRTHTGEKPFRCKTCNKCFNESGNLNRHIKTHASEKP